MKVLINRSQQSLIIDQLTIADTLLSRIVGLLGRSALAENQGLWIKKCNSIHTFGMKFSIDCIFLDKNLKVRALRNNIHPWRLVLPVWGADSVIELAGGKILKLQISKGDQLYVGD